MKISTHASDFIRQYIKQIMEYKLDFVVGAGSFLDSRLDLLFLNVIFTSILEGAGIFKEIKLSVLIPG